MPYVYPDPIGGFFLKGGIGTAFLMAEISSGGWSYSETESGFGLTLGAGYDIGFGGRFSLTPHAKTVAATSSAWDSGSTGTDRGLDQGVIEGIRL